MDNYSKNCNRHFEVECEFDMYSLDMWPGDTVSVSSTGFAYLMNSEGQFETWSGPAQKAG